MRMAQEVTMRDTTEARKKISEEFVRRYREWLSDLDELPDRELGRKYGGKPIGIEQMSENKKVEVFRKYVFAGHYLPDWERAGINRTDIWILYQDGFLSYQYYSDCTSRMTGKSDFFYLSKATAMQIMREVIR